MRYSAITPAARAREPAQAVVAGRRLADLEQVAVGDHRQDVRHVARGVRRGQDAAHQLHRGVHVDDEAGGVGGHVRRAR